MDAAQAAQTTRTSRAAPAAREPSGWCRCNGEVVVRATKQVARGQAIRQKTGCLACGARAVRWLPRQETQEASDGLV